MSNVDLENLLKIFDVTEVYFGSDGFRIYAPKELSEAQIGYSQHPDGTDLTGQEDGDWKREWIVIGYDTSLGDPYFVDTSKEQFPVYTAMHGQGSWDPSSVSPTLRNFLSSLDHLRSQSTQDDSLVEPDDSTLTDRDRIKALEKELSRLNGEDDFWEAYFESYVDWLEESELDDL